MRKTSKRKSKWRKKKMPNPEPIIIGNEQIYRVESSIITLPRQMKAGLPEPANTWGVTITAEQYLDILSSRPVCISNDSKTAKSGDWS